MFVNQSINQSLMDLYNGAVNLKAPDVAIVKQRRVKTDFHLVGEEIGVVTMWTAR